MVKPNDLSRSRVALEEDSTLIAVIELSLGSWLVAGRIPGVDRTHCESRTRTPTPCLSGFINSEMKPCELVIRSLASP
jgi:hypothetical protein